MAYRVIALGEDLREAGELKRVRSIQIDRAITDKVPLLESCSMEIDCETIPSAGWFRVERHGTHKDVLGTFWFETESTSYDKGIITARLTGRSVLAPAADAIVPIGAFARRGDSVEHAVSALLSMCPANVTALDDAKVPETIVFGDGCTSLEAAWMVLDAVGWRIRLDGYGRIFIESLPSEPSRVISERTGGVMNGFSRSGGEFSYSVKYDGADYPGDLVDVQLPRYGIRTSGRLLSQGMTAAPHLMVNETIGGLER